MGHSYAGEITHDVSHYFHLATPEQRLANHLNTSNALTNPTLEQVMISDHPPFAKRADDLKTAMEKDFPYSGEPANYKNGFVDFVRSLEGVLPRKSDPKFHPGSPNVPRINGGENSL